MKRFCKVICIFCVIVLLTLNVSAATSNSYVYDSEEKAVSVPSPYTVEKYLDTEFNGIKLNTPSDLCVNDSVIYILDSGNNRIIKLNENFEYLETVSLYKGGEPVSFKEAKGIFVDRSNKIYVADKEAQIVYVAKPNGEITTEILSPPKDKVDEDFEFTPISVIADTTGIVYVISSGSYGGALQYDNEYNFLGFYGSEQVTVTAKVLLNEFWKKILSKEAASGLTRNVPTSIVALDIDKDNFVYTLKGGSSQSSGGQIRRLNTLGSNIFLDSEGNAGVYGDTDTYYDSSKNLTVSSSLTDLVVDDYGFVTALDRTYNRLFQYDMSTNMLYALGGKEERLGNFSSPVAVEAIDDKILVLDDKRNSLTVLKPTYFAECVRKATVLNEDGKYKEAAVYWEQVLSLDAYYEPANNGMGMVCEEQGNADKAMNYYKNARNKEGYSSAFTIKRDAFLKKNFLLIAICVVLLLLAAVILTKLSEKRRKNPYNIKISRLKYPCYCLTHPFKAYYEMKVEKKGSLAISNIVLAAFFFVSILKERLTSFHFSGNDSENFNILLTFFSSVGLFVLFVLCNWATSTLADGEGTLKEIWIFTSYSLIPFCISSLGLTVISRVLSLDESAFWITFWVIAVGWTAIHIFMAIRDVHQYTVKRTFGIMLITILGMYLLILIITLGYSLFTQLISFISTVISEYRLK